MSATEWAVSAVLVPAITGTETASETARPQRLLLPVGEHRALAGGAAHDEEVVAVLAQPASQSHGAVDVKTPSRIEGRHHGAAHRTEASDRWHDESLSAGRSDPEHGLETYCEPRSAGHLADRKQDTGHK